MEAQPSDGPNMAGNLTHLVDDQDPSDDESGRVAAVVIGVVRAVVVISAVVMFYVYKQYVRKNVKSMNFDNPVYRKTTEDQFSLEKNQFHPARTYPGVTEETLEPLTHPGSNEFV
jgi:hypothetical protein